MTTNRVDAFPGKNGYSTSSSRSSLRAFPERRLCRQRLSSESTEKPDKAGDGRGSTANGIVGLKWENERFQTISAYCNVNSSCVTQRLSSWPTAKTLLLYKVSNTVAVLGLVSVTDITLRSFEGSLLYWTLRTVFFGLSFAWRLPK